MTTRTFKYCAFTATSARTPSTLTTGSKNTASCRYAGEQPTAGRLRGLEIWVGHRADLAQGIATQASLGPNPGRLSSPATPNSAGGRSNLTR